MISKKTIVTFLAAAAFLSALPHDAKAGPLLDWLRARRNCRQAWRTPNTGCSTCQTPAYVNTSYQAPNTSGLLPGQCMKTCNQTCSRTVVNYVPCTSYRTAWNRVPVTQYKPVTNSDPCTGCTVTCMKPCTSYTWQMKREPYTTYRPVYRTENYTVPVTTITNDCATGTCGTCSTCPTSCSTCPTSCGTCPTPCSTCPTSSSSCPTCPTTAQATPSIAYPGTNTSTQGTYYTYPQNGSVVTPSDTLDATGGYQTSPYSSPADTTPTLDVNPQNLQKPIIDKLEDSGASANWPRNNAPLQTIRRDTFQQNVRPVADPTADAQWMNPPPKFAPTEGKTANSTVTQRWGYSPVRFASYTSSVNVPQSSQPTRIEGTYVPRNTDASTTPSKKNTGWKTVEW